MARLCERAVVSFGVRVRRQIGQTCVQFVATFSRDVGFIPRYPIRPGPFPLLKHYVGAAVSILPLWRGKMDDSSRTRGLLLKAPEHSNTAGDSTTRSHLASV